ncbi:MAG: hypothetical protein ACREDA_06830 [Methylocella sp.]
MTDETPDLILEQFRILRADIAGVRCELASHREETRHGFTALGQRRDVLETEVRGVNYVATVSIGSLLADLNDLKTRLKCLEEARIVQRGYSLFLPRDGDRWLASDQTPELFQTVLQRSARETGGPNAKRFNENLNQ